MNMDAQEKREVVKLFLDNCQKVANRFISGELDFDDFMEVACLAEDHSLSDEDNE